MIHHRPRVAGLGHLGASAAGIGIMNGLPRQVSEFGDPLADIGAVGIVLLALEDGVEDAEVGLGVDARGGAEAPAAVVGGEVAVDEVLHEVPFAQAPVEQEVFGQKGGHRHARAVVHVSSVVQLPHGGVDEGVARLPRAPGAEVGRGVFPGDVGVFGLIRFVHAVQVGGLRN